MCVNVHADTVEISSQQGTAATEKLLPHQKIWHKKRFNDQPISEECRCSKSASVWKNYTKGRESLYHTADLNSPSQQSQNSQACLGIKY